MMKEGKEKKELVVKRVVMALLGTVLTGICIGGMQKADLGLDPFTTLVTACAYVFHSSYGNCYLILTGVLLAAAFIINRRLVGIATVFNLLLCGTTAGIMKHILDEMLIHISFAGRIILLIVCLCIVGFSTSLYFTADMGVSAYDAVALTIADRQKKVPFRICRIGSDLTCCVIGVVCGVVIGPGTVITAFMMGPVIQWFNEHVSDRILYGRH